MAGRKGHTCPYCGSPDAIPIVYGYPTMEASTEAEEGKIHLGGCCCWGDERGHKCQAPSLSALRRTRYQYPAVSYAEAPRSLHLIPTGV
jgi:hypothetical protein